MLLGSTIQDLLCIVQRVSGWDTCVVTLQPSVTMTRLWTWAKLEVLRGAGKGKMGYGPVSFLSFLKYSFIFNWWLLNNIGLISVIYQHEFTICVSLFFSFFMENLEKYFLCIVSFLGQTVVLKVIPVLQMRKLRLQRIAQMLKVTQKELAS